MINCDSLIRNSIIKFCVITTIALTVLSITLCIAGIFDISQYASKIASCMVLSSACLSGKNPGEFSRNKETYAVGEYLFNVAKSCNDAVTIEHSNHMIISVHSDYTRSNRKFSVPVIKYIGKTLIRCDEDGVKWFVWPDKKIDLSDENSIRNSISNSIDEVNKYFI